MKSGISSAEQFHLAEAVVTGLNEGGSGATLHLFQNDFVPSANVKLSDFVECDFDTYTSRTGLTQWFVQKDAISQDWVLTADYIATWATAGGDPLNTVYGWFLTNAASDQLWAWERFTVPRTLVADLDEVFFLCRIRLLRDTGLTT